MSSHGLTRNPQSHDLQQGAPPKTELDTWMRYEKPNYWGDLEGLLGLLHSLKLI